MQALSQELSRNPKQLIESSAILGLIGAIPESELSIQPLNATTVPGLNRPTLQQLEGFLRASNVSKHAYVEPSYVCMNFAQDLQTSAKAGGWNMSVVVFNYNVVWNGKVYATGFHALNGLYLANGSWVYVEPQTSRISSNLLNLIPLTEIILPLSAGETAPTFQFQIIDEAVYW
jgi:hypothetical protein